MTLGSLYQPISQGSGRSKCVPYEWYFPGCTGCPMSIIGTYQQFQTRLAVTFNGSDLISRNFCPGSSPYVYVENNYHIGVNVWKAYIDGVWASSIPVYLYAQNPGLHNNPSPAGDQSMLIQVAPTTSYNGHSLQTKIINVPSSYPALDCSHMSLQATITMNSDGTYSIA